MFEIARQSVGGLREHVVDGLRANVRAQRIEPGPFERRAADAFVDVFLDNGVALRLRWRAQFAPVARRARSRSVVPAVLDFS